MKVYLAARYSRREELLACKADLEARGFTVTSRWLEGNHQISDEDMCREEVLRTEGARFAQEDLEDLADAEVCIFFSEEPRTSSSRGGRHVEFGWAMARNIALRVIGPRENVFHCLHRVEVYENWQEYLASIPGSENLR